MKRILTSLVFMLLALSARAEMFVIENPAETIRYENFANGAAIPTTATVLIGCQISFEQPRTLANGTTVPRAINLATTATFVHCNMVNARPAEGSIAIKCNTALVARHRPTGWETLSVVNDAGTTITRTVKTYSHIVYGRGVYTADEYRVDYWPTPRVTPTEAPRDTRAARIRAKHDAYLAAQLARVEASGSFGGIE